MGRRPAAAGQGLKRVVLGAGAVAASHLTIRTGAADLLDRPVGRLAARPLGPGVDRVVGVATDLGSVYGLAGVAAALALSGRRRLAGDLAAAGLLAWTGAQAVKPALDRRRPYEAGHATRLVAEPAGSSWPSGHVAVTAAMTTSLAPWLPVGTRVAAGTATAAIGASRLYVGVHHLSDLVGGWGIGVLAAAVWHALRGRRD